LRKGPRGGGRGTQGKGLGDESGTWAGKRRSLTIDSKRVMNGFFCGFELQDYSFKENSYKIKLN
jgi:hypothetical protein